MAAEVAVVAALREEAKPLLRRLGDRRRLAIDGVRAWTGSLGGRPVLLAATGDGPRRAAAGLAALLAAREPACCLLIGVAGGLSPELEPGALVVAESVWDLDREAAVGGAGAWEPIPAGARSGVLASGRRVLWRSRQKRELWQALGRPPVAVVDTETAAWARVAAGLGVPWRAVRAVSDGPGEDLPLDFDRLRDRRGGVSRSRVVLRALLSPAAIPGLIRLRRRVTRAVEPLAELVEGALPA